MSSIYKKGRDGYYYYQKYVFNPKSGKKDKKIFHSLGTKDRLEATNKQKILDDKYKLERKKVSYIKTIINLPKITLIIPSLLVFMLIYISLQKNSFSNFKDTKNTSEVIKDEKKILTETSIDSFSKNNALNKEVILPILKNKAKLSTKKEFISDTILPIFTIQRFEIISDVFKQVKIFVTISRSLNKKNMIRVCEEIVKENQEYSNFIICLFSDSQSGLELAQGNNNNVTNKEKRSEWLAMYTLNPVEGAYFDDEPARHNSF